MHVKFSLSRWQLIAWFIGLLLVTPLGFLLVESLQGGSDVFQHLFDTVLWDYTRNTLFLIAGVGLLSCLIALPLAWLTAYCEFPGRKQFEWALMLPLAMPTYLIAYVYTDLLDYAGPVQIALRDWFGWQSPDDYWFFDIRTLTGAIVMIALVLYPYLYLIFKTALREQSFKLVQASQLMGLSPLQSFLRVSLPLGRGAIVAGITLISMEAMADFATVNYFAVSTLTTAVYDTWLGYYSLTAAAKISGIMLLILFLTLMLERYSRRNQAVYERQSSVNSATLYSLKGSAAWGATIACSLTLVLAFLLPVAVLVKYAIVYAEDAWNGAFFNYAWQSLKVAVVVSLATIILSLCVLFYQRISKDRYPLIPGRLASTGYALPGTVLAIAVLLPLTQLDDLLNAWLEPHGFSLGLVLSGTLFAMVFAYIVRFYAIAHGALESSFLRISPSLDMASQSMGKGPFTTLYKVHLPLLKRGILTAGLLVFIECMKELPAALLLRPFNFETLATHVFQYVSDEQLELASISALFIVLVGLIPLYFVNRSMEHNHS
ncbi:iron ABC transporter permease [Pseudoalteromonas lipolytica]|jgi:iron(III) transport system permease protein|uniref:Iron ABC transporter permease n=3 Tax=Pseudoalteromonas lipolytica TaxID=570156 RepID=A0AAD0S214_9GAMM|nr:MULTISPECIES: iron ABC transporter permease [Pseudoalteromonas]MAE02084.1 iron ABC transporter permease [Pseudoalteromonas sp.]AXV66253.1 iron ABC transporter permease [Pseudoalteromonas donghaensis]MBE0350615.1 iron(III) transport system permease protein [Pseudoalteromonas lipolytica LMEB 39]QMW13994.1 iron ABC transporter permease [Pseudoalteromonas sp. MT33b]SFT66090.1 iron(III) transport system permease protein [Pseudoalteromonas lipolytica]|tara:strand:- start:2618 stop:4252 length:1635 start_codon:yes stop_codon:yes gene_type:complete